MDRGIVTSGWKCLMMMIDISGTWGMQSEKNERDKSLFKFTNWQQFMTLLRVISQYKVLYVNYLAILSLGLQHMHILCSNALIFVDFGYNWYFILCSFKFLHEKKKLKFKYNFLLCLKKIWSITIFYRSSCAMWNCKLCILYGSIRFCNPPYSTLS